MRSFSSLALLGAASVAAAQATGAGSAVIIVEASHGGAGSDLTNTTIEVPVGSAYNNATALAEVSSLFLIGLDNGAEPLESITCQAFTAKNGTGSGSLPFTSSKQADLSTNTVVVGSIVCTSAQAPVVDLIIEASHGGAGSGLTNTTIQVGLETLFTNVSALAEVSTLYVTGIEHSSIPLSQISCLPYASSNGTGTHGLAASVGSPSFLSTNTVVLGSIVCSVAGSNSTSNSTSTTTSTTLSPTSSATGTPTGSASSTPTVGISAGTRSGAGLTSGLVALVAAGLFAAF